MYRKVQRKANKLISTGDIVFVVGNNETLVNSVQRFSDVIIQKSIREGFCLCVTEALWKGTPVVASNVGGIPSQIEDGRSGFLLEPKDNKGFAELIIHILKNPKEGKAVGQKGKEKVRKEFLITRLLSDHLDMVNSVMNI
jgi:trehalose synthase